ncbi:MAG: efflux RND transporter permease subunit [Planctomycetaceae bacterium]
MSDASTPNPQQTPFLTRVVEVFLRGDVAILLTLVSLILGAASLYLTPREEEPQIVVPIADLFVNAPGLSATEVEHKVTSRLEKLLFQIDGVEYVYSMSRPGQSVVTVRFYVGEDREDSLVKLYNKINSNTDQIPPGVASWVIKPIEIDDVPIVNVTLKSDRPNEYSDHELRRLAEQIQVELESIPNTNRVAVIGGRPRRIRVELDAIRLASRQTSPLQVAAALQASNVNLRAGSFEQQNQDCIVEAGTFLKDATELQDLVVNVAGGRPVYLGDIATIIDGPAEVESYSWIGYGPASDSASKSRSDVLPAVHVAVAKQKGTNAVRVAEDVHARMEELARTHLPDGVSWVITRDYGETANHKVNELVEGLVIAVLTVIGLIGLTLGWRPALVIALAIPVCYSLTLFINLMAGYTINRVTMFALILALGLLVDDPITDVENIARYFAMKVLPPREATLRAVQEVRPALILSTLAIIASFLPLAFITGMMGPYMGPMALNVPLTVVVSTFVAFLMTPWMAMVSLRTLDESSAEHGDAYDITRMPLYRFFRMLLGPILDRRWLSLLVLAGVVVLLLAAMLLPMFRLVPLKMLPYDNKNELQIVIDMPEGTTLDRTNSVALEVGRYLAGINEVHDFEVYVGTASAMDFNGMVRHYFLRQSPNTADIRLNLLPKEQRQQQSHELVLRIRSDLDALSRSLNANIKLVEVPPGPPVIATVTGEVYGPDDATYGQLVHAARRVEARLAREPGIVDVDSVAEAEQVRWVFETDKPKAALSGISTADISRTLKLALDGETATILHAPSEVDPLPVELRLPRDQRSAIDDLEEMYVQGRSGEMVQLGAVGRFVEGREDQTIYHKNLKRVAYVYGEVAGRSPADAILDMEFDRVESDVPIGGNGATPRPVGERTWLNPGGGDPWSIPAEFSVEWAGEGEWKITLDVFRDLGLAFAAALMGIFVILMFQTGSRALPMIIMLAIPLTLIGILPGFWLLNVIVDRPIGGYANPVFFTATAMIGMIGLAGIVVRNSVVLIDFIQHAQADGMALREAVIQSVAIRTRPILLTAGTTLLGNWVITLDPIFSGLAWAIIFGILTSTLFTLIVIPTVYWLLYGGKGEA